MQKVDLLHGRILPSLAKLAFPIMATQLIQMAYNLTDMIWIGRVGSGAVADELALFEFESKEDAEAAVEQAQARVTAQSESFADYIPEEVKKLDSAIVKTYGRYLVVCVSGGTEAGEIISEYFK